jgi:hypothetical protein
MARRVNSSLISRTGPGQGDALGRRSALRPTHDELRDFISDEHGCGQAGRREKDECCGHLIGHASTQLMVQHAAKIGALHAIMHPVLVRARPRTREGPLHRPFWRLLQTNSYRLAVGQEVARHRDKPPIPSATNVGLAAARRSGIGWSSRDNCAPRFHRMPRTSILQVASDASCSTSRTIERRNFGA